MTGQYSLTPAQRLKQAALSEVCQWILRAWTTIPAEVIYKSFKVKGISNALDTTEAD
jgi:hypothetical protein